MKLLRTLAAPAIALALGASLTPAANAADLTPGDVIGSAELAPLKHYENQPIDATALTPAWPENPAWIGQTADNDRVEQYVAHSPSMRKDIPLAVLPATNDAGERVEGAPTIYLLNGAGGAEQDNDWIVLADTVDFYSGKGVNIVIPMAGAFSYYMDWHDEDPGGAYYLEEGKQTWETFVTKELPGAIEPALNANNERGVIGFSMSATSSLLMAEHNPGFYDAVGSFSGCAATSGPLSYLAHDLTVDRGGVDWEQIVGPRGSDHNLYNDALVNADGLRGTELYISNGSGLAGETDMAGHYIEQGQDPAAALANSATLHVEGGVIEGYTNACTHNLKAKLDSLDIPADFHFHNTGTHSWPSWRHDLEASWENFDRAFDGV